MSDHDETETNALKERAEKAEKESDELRDENMQLKIDVDSRKQVIRFLEQGRRQIMEDRDMLMRHVGVLEGQVE